MLKCNEDTISQDFLSGLLSYSFFPCITKPTRLSNSAATLIDNIFSNIHVDALTQSGIIISDISDHFQIFVCWSSYFHNHSDSILQPRYIRSITQDKLCSLKEILRDTDWNDVLHEYNVDVAYDKFIEILCNAFNQCIPPRNTKRKNSACQARQPWVTKSLLRCINRKNKLYYRFRSRSSDAYRKKYTKYRNILTSIYTCILRVAKNNYYCSQFDLSANNTKATWKVINTVLSRNSQKKQPSRVLLINDYDYAILYFINKVATAIGNHKHTIGLFLDFSKAFDMVDHDILLYKLCHYGIRGKALDWFRSYFQNRKHM